MQDLLVVASDRVHLQVALLPVCHLRRAAGSIGEGEARAGASGPCLGMLSKKKNTSVSQNAWLGTLVDMTAVLRWLLECLMFREADRIG